MKRLLPLFTTIALAASLQLPALAGPSTNMSHGSENLSAGAGVVLVGSMSMLAASGQVVVGSVTAAADGSVVVLKGLSDATGASITLSGQAARGLSVAVGTVVGVVAISTGHILVLSGKAIAFIPNEIGKSLLHHSEV